MIQLLLHFARKCLHGFRNALLTFAFSERSGFGAAAARPTGFGGIAASGGSGFGAAAAGAPSGFGTAAAAPSGFGAAAAAPSGFGGFGGGAPAAPAFGYVCSRCWWWRIWCIRAEERLRCVLAACSLFRTRIACFPLQLHSDKTSLCHAQVGNAAECLLHQGSLLRGQGRERGSSMSRCRSTLLCHVRSSLSLERQRTITAHADPCVERLGREWPTAHYATRA